MDFNFKKPAHLFALLMMMGSFFMFIVLPIVSYFGFLGMGTTDQIEGFPDSFMIFFELFALLLQGIFVIILLILSPYVWYALVNKYSWKQMRERIKLKTDQLDMAFLLITAENTARSETTWKTRR